MNAYQEWLVLCRRDCYTYLCVSVVLSLISFCYLKLRSDEQWVFQATLTLFLCAVLASSTVWRLFQLRKLFRDAALREESL